MMQHLQGWLMQTHPSLHLISNFATNVAKLQGCINMLLMTQHSTHIHACLNMHWPRVFYLLLTCLCSFTRTNLQNYNYHFTMWILVSMWIGRTASYNLAGLCCILFNSEIFSAINNHIDWNLHHLNIFNILLLKSFNIFYSLAQCHPTLCKKIKKYRLG